MSKYLSSLLTLVRCHLAFSPVSIFIGTRKSGYGQFSYHHDALQCTTISTVQQSVIIWFWLSKCQTMIRD